jgi:hypothetical protein
MVFPTLSSLKLENHALLAFFVAICDLFVRLLFGLPVQEGGFTGYRLLLRRGDFILNHGLRF